MVSRPQQQQATAQTKDFSSPRHVFKPTDQLPSHNPRPSTSPSQSSIHGHESTGQSWDRVRSLKNEGETAWLHRTRHAQRPPQDNLHSSTHHGSDPPQQGTGDVTRKPGPANFRGSVFRQRKYLHTLINTDSYLLAPEEGCGSGKHLFVQGGESSPSFTTSHRSCPRERSRLSCRATPCSLSVRERSEREERRRFCGGASTGASRLRWCTHTGC